MWPLLPCLLPSKWGALGRCNLSPWHGHASALWALDRGRAPVPARARGISSAPSTEKGRHTRNIPSHPRTRDLSLHSFIPRSACATPRSYQLISSIPTSSNHHNLQPRRVPRSPPTHDPLSSYTKTTPDKPTTHKATSHQWPPRWPPEAPRPRRPARPRRPPPPPRPNPPPQPPATPSSSAMPCATPSRRANTPSSTNTSSRGRACCGGARPRWTR